METKRKKYLQKELESLGLKRKEISDELDKLEQSIRTLNSEINSLGYEWVLNKWFDIAHVYNEWAAPGNFRIALFKPLEIDSADKDMICFRGVTFCAYVSENGVESHSLDDNEQHFMSKNDFKKEFKKEIDKDSSLYKEMVEIINKHRD